MPGSLTKRGENRWLLRYDLPRDPKTGKRRQGTETVRGTKKDAERRLREILTELDRGNYFVPSRQTLGEYLEGWLNKYALDHAASSAATARYLLRRHVIDELGGTQLADLVPYQIDQLYTRLQAERKLSSRTIQYVHVLLKAALDRAVSLNMLPANPAARVRPPKLRQKEVKPLTDEQKELFLAAAREDRFYNLFVVALGTGMRRGEILALKWDCVDLQARTITVMASAGGSEGKTANAKRQIPIFPTVYRALKNQAALQAQEKLKAGPLYEDNGLVFANEVGKPVDPSNLVNRHFKPALQRAGLPLNTHFHALRHTFATSLLARGEDVKKVAAWIGHGDAGFTYRVYHHYIPQALDEEESARLDEVLFAGKTKRTGA